jgi:hypothetical protein
MDGRHTIADGRRGFLALAASLMLTPLSGCEPEVEEGACAMEDAPQLLVLRTLRFALADDAGVSLGFNLDGETSTENGASGCGIADYTSPEGAPGIDNAFSRLTPALESTEAKISAIEGLVQAAITSGELLIALELGGLEDWDEDSCVAGEVGQAAGTPMLGTDGLILDGQTFDRDETVDRAALHEGKIVGGVYEADGLSVDLPVQILNASLVLPLREGRVRVAPSGADTWEGFLAGRVSAAYMLEIAQSENIDPAVADLLGIVLIANADFDDEDGTPCGAVSVTLQFEAVGAYYYQD